MALTITRVSVLDKKSHALGDLKYQVFDVTFDNSYPDGGEPVAKADFGLDVGIGFIPDFVAVKAGAGDTAFAGHYDATAGTLQLFYGDNNNASDGPLIELPDTTSAASYVARLIVVGK